MINIRHTGIVVTDLARAKTFYCDLLGFEVWNEQDESGSFIDNFSSLEKVLVTTSKMILENGDMIELLQYKSHPEVAPPDRKLTQIGCSHIALTVLDLDTVYTKFRREGISFNSPPQLSPDGKAKVTFCKDPDGNFIELVEEL
tara:strand:+ start:43039 stop:43467 length:429 start_codon:yes stop_codon:yes gene_type:complete